MWKKAKRFLAVLLALTLMLSVVDSEELFVSASATNVQEDTGAGGETEPAAGEETKSTDVSVEEDTAVTSVGDEGSGEDTATVPGDGTGTGTETGGAADATGTDGTETAGTGTETSGSGTEGAEGTTVPGSETPVSGTEGTEGAAGTGDTTAGESGETEGDVTDGTTEAADDGTDGTTTAPGTVTDGIGSEGTGMETETGENGTDGTEDGNVTTDGADDETDTASVEENSDSAAEDEAEEQPVRYTAQVDQDDQQVNVIVDVPAGAFDTDMEPKLHASLLTEQDEVDKAAAEVAEQTDAEFDGMLVLDVYFTDGDTDTEIEPAVPVSVRFELPEGVLPENIDPSTLTVHHLAETDDNGDTAVQVETVATSATDDGVDGIVALSADAAEAADASGEVNLIDDFPDIENETEDGIENPAVVAEFGVESFSRFTISYGTQRIIWVYLVNENGQELWNGVISFDDLDDMYNPTDFEDKYIRNQWISIEELASTWASKTEGYVYQRAYRTYQSWNGSRQEDIVWIRFNTTNTGGWFDDNSGWRYSTNSNNAPDDGSGDGSLDALYLVYEPVTGITENPNLKIENTVSGDGSLRADYNGTGNNLYYVWEKSEDGQTWNPIMRLKMNGDQYNLTEEGQVLNAALEVVNDENDEGGQWFRVSVYESKEAYESGAGALATSASMQLEYYDTLRNGNFETPSVSDLGTSNGNYQYPNGTDGLIWQTTGSDRQIEIVDADSEVSKGYYYTNNDAEGPEGHQFAELNAEAAGALYQDVLTVPGTSLNWQFYHRGRGSNANDNREDTMYLLIAPTNKVENITTQDQLEELIDHIQDSDMGYTTEDGYYLYTASDDNNQWKYYSSDSSGADAYKVPENQYLTRFFFVAGETAADQTDNGWTIGNLLDDVLFTTELLPAQPGTANLTVRKVVTGISEEDIENYTVEIELTGGGISQNVTLGGEGHPFSPQSDGSYVAEWNVQGIPVEANGSKVLTVTEIPDSVSGYTSDGSTVIVNGGDPVDGMETQITLREQDHGNIVFANNYDKVIPPEPLEPMHQKYIKDNEDGTYDLTLNVKGQIETTSGADTQIDLLYVLDNSTSMNYNMGWGQESRLTAAKSAISTLENTLNSIEGLDLQHALVIFSSEHSGSNWENTYTAQGWTKDPLNLNNIQTTGHAGGTNYVSGISEAKEVLLQGTRSNAIQVVIFISDGEPNRPDDTDRWGRGDSPLDNACEEVADLSADRFYAIGVGGDVSESTLSTLINAAENISSSNKSYYSSSDSAELAQIFRNLAAEMISIDCSDVKISDILSDYAELADDAEFEVTIQRGNSDTNPLKAVITLEEASSENGHNETISYTDDSGEQQEVSFNVKYDEATSEFILEFYDEYTLEDGWIYSITTTIQPTELANSVYQDTGYGNMVGDPDTDAPDNYTSSGQPGFYSNDSATLSYTSNEIEETKDYAKPVIQVKNGSLTITKNVDGINTEDMDLLSGKEFTINISKDGSIVNSFSLEAGESESISLLEGEYTVEEVTTNLPTVEGYDFVDVSYQSSASVDIIAGESANVTVTNTYEHNEQTLTVRKFVTGNMSHEKDVFNFTLTLTENGQPYTGEILHGKLEPAVNEDGQQIDGKYSFTLTAEEGENTLVIELPYGVEATVEETDSEYTEFSRSFLSSLLENTSDGEAMSVLPAFMEGQREVEVTMTDDYTVDFQNKLEIVDPPTGLDHDSTPYTLMVTIASFAGLALIGSLFAYRNRRRHRM